MVDREKNAQIVLARLVDACKSMNLLFTVVEHRQLLHMKIDDVLCVISAGTALKGLSAEVAYVCAGNAPAEKRLEVAKVLATINDTLQLGSWEIDFRDGEVRFKINVFYDSLDVEHSRTVFEYTKTCISVGHRTFSNGVGKITAAAGVEMGPGGSKSSGGDNGDSELHEACREGDLERVKRLVAGGVSVNKQNNKGVTPLICAANKNHAAIVSFLLDKGAHINHESLSQDTALSLAIWRGASEAALVLIRRGAQVDHVDKFGDTPLIDATKKGMHEVAKALLGNPSANPEHRNHNGDSAYEIALRRDDCDDTTKAGRAIISKLLAERGSK